ncbi:unnamed protein product [Didymodactylos carnosus]|uniref:Uncharacterized protein n=1 Tax=Didymodactylos carnosus TaxID=1234261 RepID=A0A814CSW2_9BILA|nr:unnamed protein product [Didymodactylos carnosus]CAF1470253.1 unnamed protein product [Didymodactylos carnosus]CAF3720619.1 unnamed protein product [Didymodactylos carnosus]CAF4262301.1 unnamed protein product [Didymodactylos carnosus]
MRFHFLLILALTIMTTTIIDSMPTHVTLTCHNSEHCSHLTVKSRLLPNCTKKQHHVSRRIKRLFKCRHNDTIVLNQIPSKIKTKLFDVEEKEINYKTMRL